MTFKRFIFVTILLIVLFVVFSCEREKVEDEPIVTEETTEAVESELIYEEPFINSDHVAMGVPVDEDNSDDYYIIRDQYVISYNHKLGVPNWVSWNLDSDWFGDAERFSGNFKKDNSLPDSFYKVRHSDYTNSGFDRGHIVRSEERTLNDSDNLSTFYMTNVMPQTPDLNRGVWLDLEYLCEELCKEQNKDLYIIAGGVYHSNSTLKDEGKVAIPDSCFKIIVVLDKGESIRNVSVSSEIIAVMMPNIQGIRSDDFTKYLTTIDQIEASTSYNFLDCLPDVIEDDLEDNTFNSL